MVAALEGAWVEIRARNPEVPAVVMVLGVGPTGASGGGLKLGHFAAMHWADPDPPTSGEDGAGVAVRLPEVFIGGERLARGPADVLSTLLHEAAHALAHVRGVKDTSRQGRWHNGRFKALAEELGIEVTKDSRIGWSPIAISAAIREMYAEVIAELGRALRLHRSVEITDGGQTKKSSPSPRIYASAAAASGSPRRCWPRGELHNRAGRVPPQRTDDLTRGARRAARSKIRYPELLVAPVTFVKDSQHTCSTESRDGDSVSEDLVSRHVRNLGRLGYLSLGSTTLAQLKRSKFVRGKLTVEEERRKPDGIVFLPLGGIKAVIEAKVPRELTASKLSAVVKDYSPIARAVCKLLIITDGRMTYWYNALTERPVLDEDGNEVRFHMNLTAIDNQSLQAESEAKLVTLIEKADYSLSEENDRFHELRVIDPSSLAKSVWQKIWINTGKEPEKCLYNVVEILVFKFLSDLGVLTGNHSFRRVVELLVDEGDSEALDHYGRISRNRIRGLFPQGDDGTTVINGTIFVNEAGEPNLAQAGLFGEVIRAFQAYDDENGSLQYIDRQFKTRLYESFLRQQAGIRSLGQYFTPRNVVQAIVRMSNAATLRDGDSMCDPFCGVGGFLLEAIAENANLAKQFEPHDGKVRPSITVIGYDKGTDEKDDERTIILAKANMLVYLSDLLSEYHSEAYLKEFASNAFNAVFHLIRSNLGTFERVDSGEQYNLILTNPPYVTSGSASIRSAIDSAGLEKHYSQGGRGTEALAIQWIINHLKPGGQAFVVVPDGLMNQGTMLSFIKANCDVLNVVALPSRTFYSTPKKTYILGLRKKEFGATQKTPVFTCLVSEMGESRDTRRVPIEANDLVVMEREFTYFRAASTSYVSSDPRCKIVPWSEFDSLRNWLVDRSWTHEEKVELGIVEENFEVDAEALRDLVGDARAALDDLLRELT